MNAFDSNVTVDLPEGMPVTKQDQYLKVLSTLDISIPIKVALVKAGLDPDKDDVTIGISDNMGDVDLYEGKEPKNV